MKIREMQLIIRVAETRSMTLAGQQLHLTPAAVSAAVQRVEESVGVRLFERTTRSLHPTEEGLVFIAAFVAGLVMGNTARSAEKLEEFVRAFCQRVTGMCSDQEHRAGKKVLNRALDRFVELGPAGAAGGEQPVGMFAQAVAGLPEPKLRRPLPKGSPVRNGHSGFADEVITPKCRRTRGAPGAWDEAVRRLAVHYSESVKAWGASSAEYALTLSLKKPEECQ